MGRCGALAIDFALGLCGLLDAWLCCSRIGPESVARNDPQPPLLFLGCSSATLETRSSKASNGWRRIGGAQENKAVVEVSAGGALKVLAATQLCVRVANH